MQRNESKAVRATIEYQPNGKRPRGRPRKRWVDGVPMSGFKNIGRRRLEIG